MFGDKDKMIDDGQQSKQTVTLITRDLNVRTKYEQNYMRKANLRI